MNECKKISNPNPDLPPEEKARAYRARVRHQRRELRERRQKMLRTAAYVASRALTIAAAVLCGVLIGGAL